MKKNIVLAVIATAAMALSLVACGGVTISGVALPESMNLEKGATQQLQLEYSAEGEVATDKIAEAAGKLTVEWSSSDETVVTVDTEGNVTAVSAGEAYVTATVKDKDALTATTMVRVAVTPTGVEAPETLELVTNGENTKNLDAKIVPEGATGVKLAYESSDEAVAIVDENGMVTAVADGECVITAYVVSSEEGTPVDTEVADSEPVEAASADSGEVADATVADSDATASEPVAEDSEVAESEQVFEPLEQETAESEETADTEVLDPEFATMMEDLKAETKVTVTTKVDAITLSQNEGTLSVGKSVALTATVTPENAADTTVTWSSSDETVATVDSNGKVTAISSGNATITATAGEKSANYEVTVEQPKKAATSNKTYTKSSSNNSAAVTPSNPAPVTPTAPVAPSAPTTPVQPSNPEPAAPAPAQPSNPEPAQPSQPSGGDSGSTENKPNGSGGWEWGGPVISTPTDNGCPPEEHAGGLC